jgi:hypothetical protein
VLREYRDADHERQERQHEESKYRNQHGPPPEVDLQQVPRPNGEHTASREQEATQENSEECLGDGEQGVAKSEAFVECVGHWKPFDAGNVVGA